MPACHYPNGSAFAPIKETVGWDNHLPKGEVRKFRNEPTGFGKSREPSKSVFSLLAEPLRCLRVVLLNIG